MRRRTLSALRAPLISASLGLVLLSGIGPVRLFGKSTEEIEPVPEPPPPPPPAPRLDGPLFGDLLPFDPGPRPPELANGSAQGCYACHRGAHEGWASGPHNLTPSAALREATARTGVTACGSCHLPLLSQHDQLPVWSPDDEPLENPDWDATLQLEGVTCMACHVREGKIVVSTEDAARGEGLHDRVWSPQLASSEGCATCHQLTWPGANLPLYDTYGEWSRSAWAEAGVGCLDCHRRDRAHSWTRDPARAVSLILAPEASRIVRGGEPLRLTLELQNTGAGHAIPTGTPFRGLELSASLWAPGEGPDAEPTALPERFSVELVRRLDTKPPWYTLEDTRLAAGGAGRWTWEIALGNDQPPGSWELIVQLAPTLQGQVDGPPILERRLPLVVE
ncbi:MAG TPA: hypothetical protein ENK18_26675 [Deltaproteobacteria bacterium]|nr:hypothetical protein [Deltaproteobacteria bacterium]